MTIFVFGGAFDPPHNGHALVITSVLSHQLADEVWLVPSANHPFDKKMSVAVDRLQMVRFFHQNLPADVKNRVKVITYELEKQGVGYSYDTLTAFRQKNPENQFFWLIGSDNVPSFPKWKEYLNILTEFGVKVYPRKGAPAVTLLEGMQLLFEVPTIETSSTEIRQAIQAGKEVSELVGEAVSEYILAKNLYVTSF